MSIHDRDYYREETRGFRWNLPGVPAKWLIIGATSAAFLVQMGIRNAAWRNEIFILEHLALSKGGLLRGEIWQVLTHMLLHGGFGHLFWNMVALFFFASVAERFLLRGEMLRLYVLGGLGGAAGVVLWALAGLPGGEAPVVGASGAVTAVLVWAAFRAPRTPFFLFFVLPVPLWVLGVLYVGVDAWKAASGTAGMVAVQAHLGGAAAGALLYFRPWRRGRPRGTVRPSIPRRRPASPPEDTAVRAREEEDEARVDRLLERIHASGIESLSEEEREFLKRVSRRYRR